jgi:hypothetical protein
MRGHHSHDCAPAGEAKSNLFPLRPEDSSEIGQMNERKAYKLTHCKVDKVPEPLLGNEDPPNRPSLNASVPG